MLDSESCSSSWNLVRNPLSRSVCPSCFRAVRLTQPKSTSRIYKLPSELHFLWVAKFPLITRADDGEAFLAKGRWSSMHHPFMNNCSGLQGVELSALSAIEDVLENMQFENQGNTLVDNSSEENSLLPQISTFSHLHSFMTSSTEGRTLRTFSIFS